jgi:hypothetical protein
VRTRRLRRSSSSIAASARRSWPRRCVRQEEGSRSMRSTSPRTVRQASRPAPTNRPREPEIDMAGGGKFAL